MPDVLSGTRARRLLMHTTVYVRCLLSIGNSRNELLFSLLFEVPSAEEYEEMFQERLKQKCSKEEKMA